MVPLCAARPSAVPASFLSAAVAAAAQGLTDIVSPDNGASDAGKYQYVRQGAGYRMPVFRDEYQQGNDTD